MRWISGIPIITLMDVHIIRSVIAYSAFEAQYVRRRRAVAGARTHGLP
jgi:hypothetical protein